MFYAPTRLEIQLNKFMASLPFVRDATTIHQCRRHFVRPRDKLQTTVLRRLRIDDDHDFNKRHLSHVVVGWSVDMSDKAVGIRELVVDFIFEEKRVLQNTSWSAFRNSTIILFRLGKTNCTYVAVQLLENRPHALAQKKIGDGREVRDDVLGAHQLLQTSLVYLVVGHPLTLLAGPGQNLAGPLRELAGFGNKAVFFAWKVEESISLVSSGMFIGEEELGFHFAFSIS